MIMFLTEPKPVEVHDDEPGESESSYVVHLTEQSFDK